MSYIYRVIKTVKINIMKNLDTFNLENQIRELATLETNNSGFSQDDKLFFVQLDNTHAVANDGSIFQIYEGSVEELKEMANYDDSFSILLAYVSEKGTVYNYAEDNMRFEEDSEELDIYSHCVEQAELNKG